MKKTLSTILLGASLIFGNLNKAKAQECECQTYNHDADEFPEEIICWKREGFNELKQKYERSKIGLTIIYHSDKDSDNFHENIMIFNCNNFNSLSDFNNIVWVRSENFYIDKKTGLIDYNIIGTFPSEWKWNKYFASKEFIDIAREGIPSSLNPEHYSQPYLTPQNLCDMKLDTRIKTLINAGEDGNLSEIKRLAEVERNYFKTFLKNME